ncbi:thiol-disulfide isomerase/thioredoxin [Chryseobacterium sp. SLBN-27]|uniref:TlpA family protein disulfide reductase n=1 Tax=Chryseobacterium sp. SLBN-27 TaxID=3042287 RepID=UPI002858A166|nr:redoxin domain-containing protein [Chryseobacterium sp. SLBN-27]MDR6159362.1 thiol-disulfide isomerase/thioredoxin [Chryseobacterium sp. SLBN-27]
MKNKVLYLLLFLFAFCVMFLIFKSKIVNNTTITFKNKNLTVENSPFYKKYYDSNEITVVNIWATWCKPCLEEIPSLNKLKLEYKDNKINFISFSIDNMNDIEKLKKFIATKKFEWEDITIENLEYKKHLENLFYDKKPSMSFVSVSSFDVPRTLVIRNKKIIKEYNGLIDYNNISEFLKLELKNN